MARQLWLSKTPHFVVSLRSRQMDILLHGMGA